MFTNKYVEIEPQKKLRYIMNINNMLEVERNDISANQKIWTTKLF